MADFAAHLVTASSSLSLIHPTKNNYLILSRIAKLTTFLDEVGYYVTDDFTSELSRTVDLANSFRTVYYPQLVALVSKLKAFVKSEASAVHLDLKTAVKGFAVVLEEADPDPDDLDSREQDVLGVIELLIGKAEEMVEEWRDSLAPALTNMASVMSTPNFQSLHTWAEVITKAHGKSKDTKTPEFEDNEARAYMIMDDLRALNVSRAIAVESLGSLAKVVLEKFTTTLTKLHSEIKLQASRSVLTSQLLPIQTAFSKLNPLLPPSLTLSPPSTPRIRRSGVLDYHHYGYWYPPRSVLSQRVAFDTSSADENVDVLYGLTRFDIETTSDSYGVYTSIDNIGSDGFNASIQASTGSTLYGAGLSWLEIPRSDKRFRTGDYSLDPSTLGMPPGGAIFEHKKAIDFAPFSKTPVVFAWLRGFDIARQSGDASCCCYVRAENPTPTGFTLTVRASMWTKRVEICWLAYDSSAKGAWGELRDITFEDDGSSEGVLTTVTQPAGLGFTKAPQMFVALTWFDASGIVSNLRLTSRVGKAHDGEAVEMRLWTWGEKRIRRAEAFQFLFEF